MIFIIRDVFFIIHTIKKGPWPMGEEDHKFITIPSLHTNAENDNIKFSKQQHISVDQLEPQ